MPNHDKQMTPKTLRSFDGTEKADGFLARPDRYRHLLDACAQGKNFIPRGAALTYCNASAGNGVATISTLAFNRILEFSPQTGSVVVEPGIRLGDLFKFTVPRGFLLAIMPGHPSITVGGCIGCDIHGKNQHREGNFENSVEELTVYHPEFGERQCSRQVLPELFDLTLGGFGLTGVITSARLKLAELPGDALEVRRRPVGNLIEAVELLQQEHDSDVVYSWHDFNRRGARFGQGYLYSGRFLVRHTVSDLRFQILTPENRRRWPVGLLSSPVLCVAMRGYGWAQRLKSTTYLEPLPRAMFPIVGKESYFRIYGSAGFQEYQVIVPFDRWSRFADRLRSMIAESGVAVGLASLKLFSGKQQFLRFDGTGVCLAIDVPAGERARRFFASLDALTLDLGGTVNIAKDSRLNAEFVRRVFPQYDRFRDALANHAPKRHIQSCLRKRLDV